MIFIPTAKPKTNRSLLIANLTTKFESERLYKTEFQIQTPLYDLV